MSRIGLLFVVGAAVLWGTTGTTQALAPAGATPLAVAGVRVVFGGATLLAIAFTSKLFSTRPPAIPLLLLSGSVAFHQIAFFAAVERTGVAVGTVVTIGSSPVAAGILGLLVHRDRPGRRWYGATFLAVLGCVLLGTARGAVTVDPLGILLALAAGAGYALYTVVSKSLLETQHPGAVVALSFGGAALVMLPVLLSQDLAWILEARGAAAAAWLSLATVGVAYSLFGRGLALVSAGTAVTLTLSEPVVAALLGVAVLGEPLPVASLVGIALVFAGLAYLGADARLSARQLVARES
jgi:drug/metabolite transporter, DME family